MYSSREHDYDGIETHDGHAAINVKHYGFPTLPEEDEPFGEAAYETIQAMFWEDAIGLAHERGYSCVFSEGRSGGWLVPFYQRGISWNQEMSRNLKRHAVTGVLMMHTWPGQGGELGYPEYPSMDSIGERSRFRAYQRSIEAMLEGVGDSIKHEAAYLREQALEAVV